MTRVTSLLRKHQLLRRAIAHARVVAVTRRQLDEQKYLGCHIVSLIISSFEDDIQTLDEFMTLLRVPIVRSNATFPRVNRLVRLINHWGQDHSLKSVQNACTEEAFAAHILNVKRIYTEEEAMAFFRVQRGAENKGGIQGVHAGFDVEGNEIPLTLSSDSSLNTLANPEDYSGKDDLNEDSQTFLDISKIPRFGTFRLDDDHPPLMERNNLALLLVEQVRPGTYEAIEDGGTLIDDAAWDSVIQKLLSIINGEKHA